MLLVQSIDYNKKGPEVGRHVAVVKGDEERTRGGAHYSVQNTSGCHRKVPT